MINNQTQNDLDVTKKRDYIKKLLSEHIGVEEDDIHLDDSLSEDLHMSSSDLTDFINTLNQKGVEIDLAELSSIDTLEELLDKITQEEF
jgi:acyl carrier protein